MPIYKTKVKKNGLWQYRVKVNYTDIYGNYKQVERIAYGSAEAKALESKLMMSTSESHCEKMTVGMLYEEYIRVKASQVRASTLDKTTQICTREILPILENCNIHKLNAKILQNWKDTVNCKDLAIITKQNAYKEFSALLNYAVKVEYLERNPLVLVGNFKEVYFKHEKEKLRYYTPNEFLKYIEIAKFNNATITDWGYYVFFNIAYYTGLRKGEINALKWSDIESNMLHVRRSISQKLKNGDFEGPPKNKSSYRSIQLPNPLIEILDDHKLRQQLDSNFNEDFRVCGGIKTLRDTTLSNRNIKYAKESNLHKIKIHDFRHSHASLLANSGINIQEISRRLGHAKIEITWNTYSHLYPREEEKAIEILNNIK